jgi:hypothetical protein
MAADLEPRLLELLRKNFSKRSEDRLAPGELDVLRAVRATVGPETWSEYERAGRAAERARRKAEREVQLLFAALTGDSGSGAADGGGIRAAPVAPDTNTGARSTAAASDSTPAHILPPPPLLSAELHVFLTHHAVEQLRLEPPPAGDASSVSVTAVAGPLLRTWAPLHAALRADGGALTLRGTPSGAALSLPLAGVELVLGGGSSGDDAALSVAPSPFMFRLLQQQEQASPAAGSRRDGTGSSSSSPSPSPAAASSPSILAVLAASSWPQLNEWVSALTAATSSARGASPTAAPAAPATADGSDVLQPAAGRRWWAATPPPAVATATTWLDNAHSSGWGDSRASSRTSEGNGAAPAAAVEGPLHSSLSRPPRGSPPASDAPPAAATSATQPRFRPAATALPPRKRYSDIMGQGATPTGNVTSAAGRGTSAAVAPSPGGGGGAPASSAGTGSWSWQAQLVAHGVIPPPPVEAPPVAASSAQRSGAATYAHAAAAAASASASASAAAGTSARGRRLSATATPGSSNAGGVAPGRGAATPAAATAPLGLPPTTGMKQMAAAVARAVRDRGAGSSGDSTAAAPSIATSPAAASALAVTTSPRLRSCSTRLTLSFSPPTPPRRASRVGGYGSEDGEDGDGQAPLEGAADSATTAGGFAAAPSSAADRAARRPSQPLQEPVTAQRRPLTRPASASGGSSSTGARGASRQRRESGTGGSSSGGAFIRADVARRSASPAPRSATGSSSGGGSGGGHAAPTALRASAAANVSVASSAAMSVVDAAAGGVAAALNFSRASAASTGTTSRAPPPPLLPRAAPSSVAPPSSADIVSAVLHSPANVSAGLSSVAAVARAIVAGGGTLSPPSQPPSPEAPASAPPSAPPSPPSSHVDGAVTTRLRAERDALRSRVEQLTAALALAHGAVGALEVDRQAQADALASLQAAATAQSGDAADVGARAAALQASVRDLRSSLTTLRAGVAASFGGVRGWLAAAAEGMQALQAATAAAAVAAAAHTDSGRRSTSAPPPGASASAAADGSDDDDDDDDDDGAALAASVLQLAGIVGDGSSGRARAVAAAPAEEALPPPTATPSSVDGGALLTTLRTHGALVSLPDDASTNRQTADAGLRRRVADAVRAAASAEGCALVLVSAPADAQRACNVVLGADDGDDDAADTGAHHRSLFETALLSAHASLQQAAPAGTSREVQVTVTAMVLAPLDPHTRHDQQEAEVEEDVDVHVFDVFAPSEDALAVVPLRGGIGSAATPLQCRRLSPCSGSAAHPRAVPADASALVFPLAADAGVQAAQLASLLRGGVRSSLLLLDEASAAATVVVAVDLDWVDQDASDRPDADAAPVGSARLLVALTGEPLTRTGPSDGASVAGALAAVVIDGAGAGSRPLQQQHLVPVHPLTQLLAAVAATDEDGGRAPQRLSRIPTAHVAAALVPTA